MKYFIRFGDIPENEKSGIYRTGREKIGEEIGVSVYDAIKIDNQWRIIIPTPLTEKGCNDLFNFYYCTYGPFESRNIYVVTGDIVGKGTINEPLIKNITIIEQIDKI